VNGRCGMKKLFLIIVGLVLSSGLVGCATTTPLQISADLPKTKFLIVRDVVTYKEFKIEEGKNEVVFSEPVDEEYGKAFEKAFKEKLQENGFTILPGLPAKEDDTFFLIIKVCMAKRPPPVPLLTNGFIFVEASIYNKEEKLIWRFYGSALISSIITTDNNIARRKVAPSIAETVTEGLKLK
jgi:hypothetical protein